MSELSDIIDALKPVSTATITTVLLKHGLRRVWMRGTRPIRSGQPRIIGRAFTLRFIPAREDLATPASWSSPRSTRAAIEDMPPGCVVVADAMGVMDAGIFGDILCADLSGAASPALSPTVCPRHGGRSRPPLVWCRGAAIRPRSPVSPSSIGGSRSVAAASASTDDLVVVDDDGAALIQLRSSRTSVSSLRSRSAWRRGSWMRSRTERSCRASIRRTKRTSNVTRTGLPVLKPAAFHALVNCG